MHELGITRNIVAIACENAAGRRIRRVVLKLGVHAGVAAEAITFCFGVVARGTLCEGASLDIQRIDGRARCRGCSSDFALPERASRCACGHAGHDLLAGNELSVHQIEMEIA